MKNFTNKIIEGNTLTILPQLPDGSVKLVLCDPPYYTACKQLLPKEIETFDDYLV